MFIKKVGMTIVYFGVGFIFDYLLGMLGLGAVNGFYSLASIIVIGVVICGISGYLRDGKLRKEHKGDESEEKRVFNSTVKDKVSFIVKTPDFKSELVLIIISAVILIVMPILVGAAAYGAEFFGPGTVVLIVLWMIFMPLYMIVLNIIAWYRAYNKCYKRKEF